MLYLSGDGEHSYTRGEGLFAEVSAADGVCRKARILYGNPFGRDEGAFRDIQEAYKFGAYNEALVLGLLSFGFEGLV